MCRQTTQKEQPDMRTRKMEQEELTTSVRNRYDEISGGVEMHLYNKIMA